MVLRRLPHGVTVHDVVDAVEAAGFAIVGAPPRIQEAPAPPTDDAGTAVGGIRAATADRRRNDGPKLRENFYRFQQREKRRGELYELKMRFEADKDRVAKLKASRKFRPT